MEARHLTQKGIGPRPCVASNLSSWFARSFCGELMNQIRDLVTLLCILLRFLSSPLLSESPPNDSKNNGL